MSNPKSNSPPPDPIVSPVVPAEPIGSNGSIDWLLLSVVVVVEGPPKSNKSSKADIVDIIQCLVHTIDDDDSDCLTVYIQRLAMYTLCKGTTERIKTNVNEKSSQSFNCQKTNMFIASIINNKHEYFKKSL